MEAWAEEYLERSLPGMLSVLSLGEPAVSKDGATSSRGNSLSKCPELLLMNLGIRKSLSLSESVLECDSDRVGEVESGPGIQAGKAL